jgi:putative ABC transport system permease protein
MFKNYALVAIRKLLKHKAYAFINILGLAIGLSSCLIIYLVTHFELSYDRFHPGGNRIYRVVATIGDSASHSPVGGMPNSLPLSLQAELTGCEVSAFYNYSPTVAIPGKEIKKFDRPERGISSPIIVTEQQYFDIFNYHWLAGSATTSLKEPFKVVLTEKEMRQYFGTITPEAAIGRQVIYDDSLITTVSGIVKDWDANTDLGFRDFISISTVPHSFLKEFIELENSIFWSLSAQCFVKLTKGTTPGRIESQFPGLVKKYLPPPFHPRFIRLSLQSLTDIHFNEAFSDNYSRKTHLPTLYGLMGIAAFILLLAVVNFVNLSMAQSMQRSKEIGIRKVLGGRRGDIVFQFLGETFLLTILAVFLSVLITPPVLFLLQNWLPQGLRLDISISTILFLIGITVFTSLLAGWFPAKVISALRPVLSLKGQAIRGLRTNRWLHPGLIVFQFTISLVFIIGTVIVTRQLHFVLNTDLGFDKDAILTLRPDGRYTAQELAIAAQKIRSLPGVAMVSRNMFTPEAQNHGGTGLYYPWSSNHEISTSLELCDSEYIPLFGLHIIAGRNFFPSDTLREILVNETCARELGFAHPGDAIGNTVLTGLNDHKAIIVGVVKDFHSNSLHEVIRPFWFGTKSDWLREISVRLSSSNRRPEDIKKLLTRIEPIWASVFPNKKFTYNFFDETIANLYAQERRISGLMWLAMLIAISISCMGLLGLVSFAAEQRNREIGIRKVLGASVVRIFTLLTVNFLWPVALAIVIAIPVSWYFMHGWLQDFAYQTTVPWWIFGVCGMAAVAIALLTVGTQVLHAARMNPVKSLRSD